MKQISNGTIANHIVCITHLVFLRNLPESCNLGVDKTSERKCFFSATKQIPFVLGEPAVPLNRNTVALLGTLNNQLLKLIGNVFWILR